MSGDMIRQQCIFTSTNKPFFEISLVYVHYWCVKDGLNAGRIHHH